MKKIEYTYSSYNELQKVLARNLSLKIKDRVLTIPPGKGSGYIKFTELPNGLQVIFFDCSMNEEILYHRKKSKNNFYVLGIDDVSEENNKGKSSLYFGQASSEWLYLAPANSKLKNINILFSSQWLESFFAKENAGETLITNLLYANPYYQYDQIDAEYRRLVQEIMQAQNNPGFENFIIQNRIMIILERFFLRQYKKISQLHEPLIASSYEMEKLKLMETEMLKDFSFPPPNIVQLSKIAAMSVSKLKLLFKKVYVMPPYQYYQKHRLQKAKAMLLSKKYNLRQTSSELGFTHFSDFSKAFKKQFDQLPEELL